MGDLPAIGLDSKQRIGGGYQRGMAAGGNGGGPGKSHLPPPPDLALLRIEAQNLTPLRQRDEHTVDQGQWCTDRRGGAPPDLLAVGAAQRRDPSFRAGARSEYGVAADQNTPDDHAREAGGPPHVAAGQIDRIHLSVDAAAVQRIAFNLDRLGESPTGACRPHGSRGVAGQACGDGGWRWAEVDAARVDASHQQR